MNMQNTANMSIKTIHHLEAAGFSRPQAKGIVRADAEATADLVTKQYADEHLVTKEYAAKYLVTKEYLRQALAAMEERINAKIADLRADTPQPRNEAVRGAVGRHSADKDVRAISINRDVVFAAAPQPP